MPHHMRANEWCWFRESVSLDKSEVALYRELGNANYTPKPKSKSSRPKTAELQELWWIVEDNQGDDDTNPTALLGELEHGPLLISGGLTLPRNTASPAARRTSPNSVIDSAGTNTSSSRINGYHARNASLYEARNDFPGVHGARDASHLRPFTSCTIPFTVYRFAPARHAEPLRQSQGLTMPFAYEIRWLCPCTSRGGNFDSQSLL
ncbi:hypothetical protein BDV95DRAFT_593260 [Massariosphaeria phaeospora]|uniref:Uncharacterized protein n=1 Tax=Massariosphaeria phaeospora TaxID=100035 RepID=A0A7C8I7U7_9PLEO|nr:hypothetical protein BDV95DRAFT_593260 [Massariosphaeria phaeospora]